MHIGKQGAGALLARGKKASGRGTAGAAGAVALRPAAGEVELLLKVAPGAAAAYQGHTSLVFQAGSLQHRSLSLPDGARTADGPP